MASFTRHAGRNVSRLWQRLREVTAGRGHGGYRPEDWAQAVADSGLAPERLGRNLRISRGIWWGRLWQLNEKRVSASENGSFQAYPQETRWCRRVMSGGLL